ncbi:MAG: hypothetical protein RQ736_07405 [Thiogranum sp.]|nr:hypothetical protein [Thiogranum sp.]
MSNRPRSPGVSRTTHDDGLQRLEKQLAGGVAVNVPVLAQWIRRYGEPARDIIRRHGQYCDELDFVES